MIVEAIVETLETSDGLVRFAHAHIGKRYLVEVDSIRRGQTMLHWPHEGEEPISHAKDIIFTIDGVWLPLECLRLQP